MILERSLHPRWLSNAWLVAAAAGGPAVLVDAGAPSEPLLAAARQHELTVTHVLVTHHHPDHAGEAGCFVDRFGAEVLVHEQERDLVPTCTGVLSDGDLLRVGGLQVEVMHVPGHTKGQLNFVVNGRHAFTGDTLFAGSVGGTRGPGHGTFAELRSSIMDRLMALPEETLVHPGHSDDTTVGREWSENPFIRAWRGLDPLGSETCEVFGATATLLVWARDYDGGHKAWVRHHDGSEDVVPGSRVRRG